MDLKNCFTTVLIIFLVFTVPVFSRGRLKSQMGKLNSEIYEIDYRGPETHSYMPPPNNPKVHGRSKRLSTENARKKLRG